MEKIAFEFAGMDLLEPMSLVTNWIIAGTCFFFFLKLNKLKGEFEHYWALFFLTFALSTFSGGLAHLFFNYTGIPGKIPVFSLAVIANFFIDKACLTLVKDEKKNKKLEYILLAKVLVSILLLVILLNPIGRKIFLIVQFNTIITVAGLVVWFSFKIKKTSEAWKFFLYAVGVLLLTAGVHAGKVNLHLWFNKDDFSHILITIAMMFFYRGVRKYI